MSRKNFKVATTEDGKTTLIKIDKTPTGNVKTIKDKEQIKKEREEQYANFRIGSLKRRAKRMGLSEEQTNECIEKLKVQLNTPKDYCIHVLFKSGQEYSELTEEQKAANEEAKKWNAKHPESPQKKIKRKTGKSYFQLAKEAILNAKIECKLLTDGWAYIEGNQEILDKLREILDGYATIHPHAKKFESVLPATSVIKTKKPSSNGKNVAKEAKKNRKKSKLEYVKDRPNHKRQGKLARKIEKRKTLAERRKLRKATTIQLKGKNGSTASKKASTGIKKAA